MDKNNNKLGMFIHWGIYALLEKHEQTQMWDEIPHEEYESLMHKFNPTKYDPKEWVKLAKDAGMKYICFTAKHHDGFCMWDTKQTDYNVMNTPYGKDVLKMLAEECEKQGMLLSIYYSNPDWYHEFGYNPKSSHQEAAKNQDKEPDNEAYRAYIKEQVKELCTNYGKIYTWFWDIPPKVEDRSINVMIREMQPGIFINDRGYDEGDFATPERGFSTEQTRFTKLTEACNSVGRQAWGYRKNENYYTIRFLTQSIDRVMAMGGSYLLNVGPMPDGRVPEKAAAIIKRIGDWYNRMEGCLEKHEEETQAFDIQDIADVLKTKKDGKTYLHFYNGLVSSSFQIYNWPANPKRVRLMNTGKDLPFKFELLERNYPADNERGKDRLYLHIQEIPADEFASEPIVIEITWE